MSMLMPTTVQATLQNVARNISVKHISATVSVGCMLMFSLCLQTYANLSYATTSSKQPLKSKALKATATAQIVPTKDSDQSELIAQANFKNMVAETARYKPLRAKKPHNLANIPAVNSTTLIAVVEEDTTQSASKHLPVKIFSHTSPAELDPILLNAYKALNRDEYAVAQQQYRQVLQGDFRNIDALLGMATIALKQGRNADAEDWNQKVLEIDPRNDIAQSLLARLQISRHQINNNLNRKDLSLQEISLKDISTQDLISTENWLRNSLALQPEAASFHAALGNLYADQNQWAAAQEAFFNACRFAPSNADYAFNLAISLDHIGQYKLALKQYLATLALLKQSGGISPDSAQLEARIKTLASLND